MTAVQQLGLYTDSQEKMEEFADRVSEYNKEKGLLAVELEAKEDANGRWNLSLYFKSRAYSKDFWTDPKYQTKIIH